MDMKHGGNVWEGQPEKWLDFSANLRPEGIPAWVMDTMQRALADTMFYPDRAMTAAKKGLAAHLGVKPEQVLPTAGGAEAIDLVLSLEKGAVHVYPHTFGEYAERATVHGRPVQVWNGLCQSGDTVMLCNPNNPTGEWCSKNHLMDQGMQITAKGGRLVVDEAFIDFCPEQSVRRYVQPGLTVVGSMTKILCIPGVRLGYVCADAATIATLEKQAVTWAVNALASAVAAELPSHKADIAADVQRNAQRREAFAGALRQLGAFVHPSAANFLLVDFRRDMTDAAAWLKERHILVRTCSSFGLGAEVWRLAVKTEQQNERFIQELEAWFRER